MSRKLIFIVCFIATALVAVFAGSYLAEQFGFNRNAIPTPQEIVNTIKPVPKKTTLYFVGDIMLDRSVRTSVKNNFKGDYNALFAKVGQLKDADILFGNLEGDVSDKGNNVGSKFSFRMDPMVLPALTNAGFDIVSFANNHVGDWNMAAFTDTLTRLESNGILKTGAGMTKNEAEIPTIIEKNGVRFGFLGFSDVGPDWIQAKENSPGILIASDPRLSEIIQNAKNMSDVLIVSFHWGVEYKTIHNARQETLAHTAIDSGADMVIGHHPHVVQDIEIYREKPIAYSLGNFIFDQYFSKETMHGMIFEATFEGKNLVSTNQKITALNKSYQIEKIYDFKTVQEALAFEAESNACPKPTYEYPDYSYVDVGQTVPIPESSYIPSDLVLLGKDISTKSICLRREARDAIIKMFADAKKDGYTIKVSSGFRDYATQKSILEREIKNGNKSASIAVAKPGHSEHQLGMAVDLTGASIANASATKKFEDTEEATWLESHAYLYGFLESYPEDKQDITGYMHEAWHYRYVGIDMAKEILKNDQTINQYLKEINSI